MRTSSPARFPVFVTLHAQATFEEQAQAFND